MLKVTGSFEAMGAELSTEHCAEGCTSCRRAENGKPDSVILVICCPVYGTMNFNVMETEDFPTI